jgi:hypothetical protein
MAADWGEYGEEWGQSRQVIAAAKSLPGSASYCVARSTELFTCLAYPDDVGRYKRQVGLRGAGAGHEPDYVRTELQMTCIRLQSNTAEFWMY